MLTRRALLTGMAGLAATLPRTLAAQTLDGPEGPSLQPLDRLDGPSLQQPAPAAVIVYKSPT